MKPILMLSLAVSLLGVGCVRDPGPANEPSGSVDVTEGDSVELDLSGRGLTAVPADILRRSDVTSLDISDNRIGGALPAEIRQMKSLKLLNASGNRMTGVPAEVGQLSELRVLDLSDNELTGLPYELGNLRNLELLDLSGNTYSVADLERIAGSLPATTVIRR